MFSVRLVNADSYQAPPSPQLDPTFSEFRGSEIKYVPIIRIFGTTPTGTKTCLHLHGAFPYMYVPYTDEKKDHLSYKLAASLDAAINISLGTATSKTQHVYTIQIVSGIPLYGYHKEQHQFLKILFYNPMIMKKAASLLQNGSVLNRTFQPHEAHIPYILQFMIDYNVHGMSWINLSTIKFRETSQPQTESIEVTKVCNILSDHGVEYSKSSLKCQSTCQLEADAFVSDILNRQEIEEKIDLNPGLAAIWNEERARRSQNNLQHSDSQLVYPKSPERPAYSLTVDDLHQERRFNRRLETISLCDRSKISKNETSYQFQMKNKEELPILSTVENPKIIFNQCSNSCSTSSLDCSVLNSADQPLIDMLDDLAQDDAVDYDSILGLRINSHNTQNDMKEGKEMEDAEYEANDLNLTCKEIESLSSWDTMEPLSDDDSHKKTLTVNNSDSEELKFSIPQLDGTGDLSVNDFDSETNNNFQVPKFLSNEISKNKCLNELRLNNIRINRPFIQLPQPKVMLQRLSPTTLKHYGCTRPLESEKLCKKIRNNFSIPSLDGTADCTSSDSESDTTSDSILQTEEKRVCVYTSKNNNKKIKGIDTIADRCISNKPKIQFSTSQQQLPKSYASLEIFVESKEASSHEILTLQNKSQRKVLALSTKNKGMNSKSASSPDNFENIYRTSQTTSDMISESRSISPLSYNIKNKRQITQTKQENEQNIGNVNIVSAIQLLNNQYDKGGCSVTFTKYLETKSTENLLLKSTYVMCDDSKKTVTIIPNINPPKLQKIVATMKLYDFSKSRNLQPFFSTQADTNKNKKLAQHMLKVKSKNMINLSVFKSRIKNLTGIHLRRHLKLHNFYSSNKKNKLNLNASTVITPLHFPPSRKKILTLISTQKNYKLIKKNKAITSKLFVSTFSEYNSPLLAKKTRTNVLSKKKIVGKINKPKNILNKNDASNLLKKNEKSNRIGFSCGQIEYQSDSTRSNITNENMNNAKTLITYDYLTIFCLELHVNTRGDLLPDPQYDSINAIFYAIKNNIPPGPDVNPLEHGIIAVISKEEYEFDYEFQSNKHFVINHVCSEIELFEKLIELILRVDPEILIGWEIEFLSWGYLFQRAAKLDLNLAKSISRIPSDQSKWKNNVLAASESLQETRLSGRIVLDVWRVMRSEMSLLTYTFENVMYHVMNERLPCPSFKALTSWWKLQQPKTRWKVIQHYCIKVIGILRVIEQLDIIGRTSEHARLFGIQFYEVFSRGSQYRVESIMLRLAKPLNYIPVSPSAHQRASMRAMESLPLIMEPESKFYTDPLIVLDFQSLYPSIIIAYNICFSTCLGRIEHIGQPDPFKFGASVLRISENTALELKGKVNFTPCGVAFVKSEVRIGILPRMLTEILDTRFMVKKAMKDYAQSNKTLHRVLHSRQHGLKYLANVTYGYTAANFSGRMPCIEVGDSVISKAKETLEKAIKLVESTSKWGARVVYGDTDSLFILIPGKSKKDAFEIGNEIADAVTLDNPSPIKLKFEKILFPSILQTKKRYCGYMYEQPDQITPKFLAKGIETVRRDGCPAVSKILEKTLKILFDTKDLSQVKHYVTRQIDKILRGKVSLDDLTFAKEFRGLRGYKEKACVPALELTRRLMKKDPMALPRCGERVRYVIVSGAPNQALIHCVRAPWEVLNDPGLRPNVFYYITRIIIPPLNRCLNLIGVEVNNWLREMPHRQILYNPTIVPSDKHKHTIFQYFGNIVCIICESPTSKGICFDCVTKPTDTLIILNEKLRWLDRINDHIAGICQSCFGRTNYINCNSLDCPVLYRQIEAENDFRQVNELIKLINDGSTFENI